MLVSKFWKALLLTDIGRCRGATFVSLWRLSGEKFPLNKTTHKSKKNDKKFLAWVHNGKKHNYELMFPPKFLCQMLFFRMCVGDDKKWTSLLACSFQPLDEVVTLVVFRSPGTNFSPESPHNDTNVAPLHLPMSVSKRAFQNLETNIFVNVKLSVPGL